MVVGIHLFVLKLSPQPTAGTHVYTQSVASEVDENAVSYAVGQVIIMVTHKHTVPL